MNIPESVRCCTRDEHGRNWVAGRRLSPVPMCCKSRLLESPNLEQGYGDVAKEVQAAALNYRS